MVFILFALWWIRDLWKVPDGRDWLSGKLGLVLMGGAMLSTSLIQFSVDGQGCVPSLLFDLRPNYGGGNEDNGDSFKGSHARTAELSAPDPAAGHHWPTPLPETPGHSQVSLGQSLVGSLLLSPWSWCTQGFVCASRVCCPVLCKSWWLYGGVNGDLLQESLCHTQVCCTQSPCPYDRPLLTCPFEGETQTLKDMSGSGYVGTPGVHKVLFWVLRASLVGMGFDFKCNFTPPRILLGLLLCPWMWGIFFWWDLTFSWQRFF